MNWEIIQKWINNPENSDQNKESKTRFIQTALAGDITSLYGVGISNGSLKKYATYVYKKNKNIEFEELIANVDKLFMSAKSIEMRVFVFFLLEKYRKLIKNNSIQLFKHIDQKWIDEVDHWTSSDHLCINVIKHLNIDDQIRDTIQLWRVSDNFWRRRLCVTALLKHTNNNAEFITTQINYLKTDKNYYVRKSFPWLLRTISQSHADMIYNYLLDNYQYFSKTELREASKRLDTNKIEEIIDLYIKYKKS